jgi:Fur family iron response transcriptional regulator
LGIDVVTFATPPGRGAKMWPHLAEKGLWSTKSVRDKLVAAGLGPTRQRLDVGRLIFQSGDRHFTAETIYGEARNLAYPPSVATIYNTLEQFVRCGLLREIAIYDSTLWYDTTIGPHHHFYNQDTKELSDIPGQCAVKLDAAAPEGTRIDAIDIIVRLRST